MYILFWVHTHTEKLSRADQFSPAFQKQNNTITFCDVQFNPLSQEKEFCSVLREIKRYPF